MRKSQKSCIFAGSQHFTKISVYLRPGPPAFGRPAPAGRPAGQPAENYLRPPSSCLLGPLLPPSLEQPLLGVKLARSKLTAVPHVGDNSEVLAAMGNEESQREVAIVLVALANSWDAMSRI